MAMVTEQHRPRDIVLALSLVAALGCASSGAPPVAAAARCQLAHGDAGAIAEHRARAVLAVLRGCDAALVARAYGATPQRLDEWRTSFVAQGIAGLLTARQVDPGELS